MNLKDRTLMILMMFTLALAGCSSDGSVAVSQAKTETKKVVVPVGKSSAPITMNYVISKENLEPGEAFSIQMNFQSSLPSSISVKTNPPEKLTLLNSQTNWQSKRTKSGERESLPVLSLVAPENGTYYVRLMASVEQDGEVFSKSFVIPVVVGDGAIHLEPVGKIVIDDNGQKILIQKGDSTN